MRFGRDLSVTLVAVALASAVRVALGPVLSDRAAFQLYTLAVMISAWVGGRRSGLLATAIATVAGVWLFMQPLTEASIHDRRDLAQIGLFFGTGIGVSILAGELRQARIRSESEAVRARRAGEALKALLESIREGFEAVDQDFRFTYLNGAAERALGRSANELIGRTAWSEFPATIGPQVESHLRRVMTERKAATLETRDESSGRWFVVAAYPFRDGISIMFRDVSHRKQDEAEREQLIAGLREALAKVRTLQGLIPICASCKKIRDDHGYWRQLESYLREHSGAEFSHGLCPDCAEEVMREIGCT